MAINIGDAESYIAQNVIDIEDWTDSDAAKKQRILTVAERTLKTAYPSHMIPDNAVYEYSAILAVVFNDTNRLAQQGIESFNISGVASFSFRNGERSLESMIPKATKDLINSDIANADLPKVGGRLKWTVL